VAFPPLDGTLSTVQDTAGDAPLLKSAQAMVATTVRTIFGQPDGAAAEAHS
jgi:hypothetical protein